MADPRNPMSAGAGLARDQRSKASLPGNLFQMDDRAIIVIGGKQVAAGDVKRDILQRLPLPSRPARSVSVPSRRGSSPLPTASSALSAVAPPLGLQRADGSVVGRRVEASSIDCSRGPTPGGAQSAIKSGEQVVIFGACFGNQPGAVELIGQFPSGSLRLSFVTWKDSEIVATAPPVRGVTDHTAALTIVRADGKRSTTTQIRFVAPREHIEVPSGLWSPSARLTWSVVSDGDGPLPAMPGSGVPGNGSSEFRLRVNPACTLDTMEALPALGDVLTITGWEGSTPFEANVKIAWSPEIQTITTESTHVLWAKSISLVRIRRMDFSIRAWADCPLGIRP